MSRGVTLVNVYATNFGAPGYVKQTVAELKGEIKSSKKIIVSFNTLLLRINR